MVSALGLIQARVRLETVTLVPVEMNPVEAFRTACQNRLDWMNARAALVDQWRQIQVAANALRGNLNVTFSGDMGTVGDNPVRFRSTTGRLRVGVQFDAPLTRLAERNIYRETLIDYQQARRAYYTFEDRVNQVLRSTLRSLRQTQLDFELRREAIRVAIAQVDFTQERVKAPPSGDIKPGQTPAFGSTLARDLVTAYAGLLTAQNSFLNAWIDYEVDRLNLDLDMGTMQLDTCGNWIDPGPIKPSQKSPEAASSAAEGATSAPSGTAPAGGGLPEEIPAPTPVYLLGPPSEVE